MASFDEKIEAQLRHEADNRAHMSLDVGEMSQSMWERIHNYDPTREMQDWELTTGQVAEMYGMSSATIGQYCKDGRFPNAYRDEPRQWWHIPATDLDDINAHAITAYTDPHQMIELSKRQWIKQFTEKHKQNGQE